PRWLREHITSLPPAMKGGGVMGSCSPPKIAFSDSDLNELEWVFESVCTAIKGPGSLTEDTKGFLRRRLFMLACNGMTDPNVLRAHLVASFVRQPLANF